MEALEQPPCVQIDYTSITKGPVPPPPPSPPGWRNEPHALSHPFPSCSAPACSSVEPPCCRSESLGCRRQTGAEIRDHPPSPPVSIPRARVSAAPGAVYPRLGAGIVPMAAVKGGVLGVFAEAGAAASLSASFLPLCRSSAPDSSRAFVSIRVTVTVGVCTGRDPPGVNY